MKSALETWKWASNNVIGFSFVVSINLKVCPDMGMKRDYTEEDIVQFLRGIYSVSGLCVQPKTRTGRMETLKEMIRAFGMNPEQILTKEAMSMPNRTVIVAGNEPSESQMDTLLKALRHKE